MRGSTRRSLAPFASLLVCVACATPGVDRLQELYETGRFEEARELAEPLAEQGDPTAEYYLALYYSASETVYDMPRAFEFYSRAAEHGSSNAQCALGRFYTTGTYVRVDPARALTWFRRAAEAGSPEALFELGWRHHIGFDVPQDFALAENFYLRAHAAGDPRAADAVQRMRDRGKDSVPPPGFFTLVAAARAGKDDAQMMLAMAFFKGLAQVQRSPVYGRIWVRRAAEAGNRDAQALLERIIATDRANLPSRIRSE